MNIFRNNEKNQILEYQKFLNESNTLFVIKKTGRLDKDTIWLGEQLGVSFYNFFVLNEDDREKLKTKILADGAK